MKRIVPLVLILILAVGIAPIGVGLVPPPDLSSIPNIYSPNIDITINNQGQAVIPSLDIQGDTILLLDISSSMKDRGGKRRAAPFTAMKQTARLLCRMILEDNPDNRVAIVTFTTRPQLASNFVDADSLSSLNSLINGLKVRSRTRRDTNLDRAIIAVDEFFDASSSADERNIIVLTDGLPNLISPKRVRSAPSTPFVSTEHKHFREANTTVATFEPLRNKYTIYPIAFAHKTNVIVSEQAKGKEAAAIEKFMQNIATPIG